MKIPYYADPATFNPARRQTIDWVNRQFSAGFCPKYFISAHFRCPTEMGSHRAGSTDVSTKALNEYAWAERRRNDPDFFARDVRDVANKLQRVLWCPASASSRSTKAFSVPTLWFIEKGVLQYHVHVLIPDPVNVAPTAAAIERAWRQQLTPLCRCLSQSQRSVDVQAIYDLQNLTWYCTKQVTAINPVIDYAASKLSAPPTSLRQPRQPRSYPSVARKPRPEVQWPPATVQVFKTGCR
ncbi:MAG: hypothetical protein WCK64_06010 [Synechococcaceae cyanobacterium ELA445]